MHAIKTHMVPVETVAIVGPRTRVPVRTRTGRDATRADWADQPERLSDASL